MDSLKALGKCYRGVTVDRFLYWQEFGLSARACNAAALLCFDGNALRMADLRRLSLMDNIGSKTIKEIRELQEFLKAAPPAPPEDDRHTMAPIEWFIEPASHS